MRLLSVRREPVHSATELPATMAAADERLRQQEAAAPEGLPSEEAAVGPACSRGGEAQDAEPVSRAMASREHQQYASDDGPGLQLARPRRSLEQLASLVLMWLKGRPLVRLEVSVEQELVWPVLVPQASGSEPVPREPALPESGGSRRPREAALTAESESPDVPVQGSEPPA
jgi:hypothetical protein